MVDRKRIELFPKACKAPVLPLSLTAHLKILHQYIVFVKLKINPILSGSDSSGSDIQGCIVIPHAVGVNPQHEHHYKLIP